TALSGRRCSSGLLQYYASIHHAKCLILKISRWSKDSLHQQYLVSNSDKFRLRFNMLDYQKTIENFDLDAVAKQYLSGSMQALNAGYEGWYCHADSDVIDLHLYGKDRRKE